MVDPVTAGRRVLPYWLPLHAGVAVFGILIATPAHAQLLSDPTQPPPGLNSPATSPGSPAPVRPRGLAMIIRAGEVRAAIIDGRRVKPGDRYGEGKIAAISENAVIVALPKGRQQIIPLYPQVHMRPTSLPPPATPDKTKHAPK